MKKWLWLIEVYVFQFPLDMLHEFAHWIFCVFTWWLGFNTYPKLHITRWPSRDTNKDHTTTTYSLMAHIAYTYYGKRKWTLHLAICSFMPFFMTVALFYFTPWWFWIYLIANITTITPSLSDINKIQKYFEFKRRSKNIRRIRKLRKIDI